MKLPLITYLLMTLPSIAYGLTINNNLYEPVNLIWEDNHDGQQITDVVAARSTKQLPDSIKKLQFLNKNGLGITDIKKAAINGEQGEQYSSTDIYQKEFKRFSPTANWTLTLNPLTLYLKIHNYLPRHITMEYSRLNMLDNTIVTLSPHKQDSWSHEWYYLARPAGSIFTHQIDAPFKPLRIEFWYQRTLIKPIEGDNERVEWGPMKRIEEQDVVVSDESGKKYSLAELSDNISHLFDNTNFVSIYINPR